MSSTKVAGASKKVRGGLWSASAVTLALGVNIRLRFSLRRGENGFLAWRVI